MWNRRDLQAFLLATSTHRLHALFHVIVALGLTGQEALGLRWTDLDIAKNSIQVARTSSTAPNGITRTRHTNPRTLQLPSGTFACLLEHHQRQQKERRRTNVWGNPNRIFTTPIGTPLRTHQVEQALHALCKLADVEPLPLDELRLAQLAHATR